MTLDEGDQAELSITTTAGAPLPEWARFMLELGRLSGRQHIERPQNTTWKIVTVPSRNFAAGLFALGFLQATISEILQTIDEIDISKLESGHPITWRTQNNLIAYGTFIRYNPMESPPNIEYTTKSGTTKRTMDKLKEFNFSPYYGSPFKHFRTMCRNLEFFRNFFPTRHFDLLCNSIPKICLIGRPFLWEDLRAHEFKVRGISGCLDDLLRVSGDNEHAIEDVSHFLTRFISPDRDQLAEVSVDCAIFDGSRAYPKVKNFVSARQNLVVLDRWESGALDSANAFAADYLHAGVSPKQKILALQIPETIEYSEWSTN